MSQQHDDETTHIETLLEESSSPDPSTHESTSPESTSPESGPPGPSSPEPASPPASEPVSDNHFGPADPSPATPYGPHQGQAAVPEYKSGPAPTTSVIGLLGLLTVIAVLVAQATDLDIPWGVVGPVAVVGAGVLLVVLGLAGLRGQRFRG